MSKTPNPKVFVALTVAATVLGSGLVYVGWNRVNDASEKLLSLGANQKDSRELEADLGKVNAELQSTSLNLQHLEQGVPEFAYIPTMLAELEKTGKTAGINVIGVRPLPKEATSKKDGDATSPRRKPYEELNIEVKGRGTYRSVMNFVQALGKFPKIVAARTVDLQPKTEPGGPANMLEVTINLRAYVFPAPKDATHLSGTRTAMATGGTPHEG